jgi:late competence protein required for DNA uptake (superfamily II DNA/RNA helicase)
MTPEQMKEVREQGACRDCMMRPMEQSRFALRNAQYCDNCLMLVEVRFGVIDQRVPSGPGLTKEMKGEA